ncbi:MAG: HAD-IA family hydrolase [Deltaproteobacteria bacterium]|uniref:HAD-IA family hydrolase n=1 Tax=Candidatus Zymogenus saltonus TaxID=2844893 RepID=A0A9D8KE58_9DELT|nr:HAD-IA family hydrolase [Candidatus Zymogenus saltonus]
MEKIIREIDLFIFDLDGTLADSKDDLKATINHTLKSFGMKALTDAETRELVGNGITNVFKNMTGKSEEEKYETIRTYIEYLESHLLDTTVPFPGVIETLAGIEKRKAVVTNKLVRMAERVVTALGMADHIDLIVGSDSTPKMKPDPAPLYLTIESFNVAPEKTVMVGDTVDDVLSAKAAGVISCGVSYGFGRMEDLKDAGADIIIDSFSDLKFHFR